MMSLAPASCSPWAMDQAMLRLLATPNTTATRPSRLKDIRPPRKVLGERKKDTSGFEDAPTGAGRTRPFRPRCLGPCSGWRPEGVFVLLLKMEPRWSAGVSPRAEEIV